ncbi:hypothetical protein GF380_01605 [Candidatus Uhrbacteria bacterium]|nr:hypothetical protein [Candidatus Uhrbacteria bacterium]MBD3283963.1 hypothetical protein [Candidatus Uhrbacteria bacterium]
MDPRTKASIGPDRWFAIQQQFYEHGHLVLITGFFMTFGAFAGLRLLLTDALLGLTYALALLSLPGYFTLRIIQRGLYDASLMQQVRREYSDIIAALDVHPVALQIGIYAARFSPGYFPQAMRYAPIHYKTGMPTTFDTPCGPVPVRPPRRRS